MALTISDHFKQSFEMSKRTVPVYFKLLLKLLAYIVALLLVIFIGIFADLPGVVRFLFLLLYFVLLIFIVIRGVQYGVAKIKAVEAVDKENADAEKIWAESSGNFWKMAFLGIMLSLIVGFGMMLLVVPGLIFLAWYGFSHFAAFIRNQDVFGALSYSKKVAAGHFWMIMGRAFLIVVIGLVIMLPTSVFQDKVSNRIDEVVPAKEQEFASYNMAGIGGFF